MITITVIRKINCGKEKCENCKSVDYSGCDGYEFACRIFGKELKQTTKDPIYAEPLRLKECIEAENKK